MKYDIVNGVEVLEGILATRTLAIGEKASFNMSENLLVTLNYIQKRLQKRFNAYLYGVHNFVKLIIIRQAKY